MSRPDVVTRLGVGKADGCGKSGSCYVTQRRFDGDQPRQASTATPRPSVNLRATSINMAPRPQLPYAAVKPKAMCRYTSSPSDHTHQSESGCSRTFRHAGGVALWSNLEMSRRGGRTRGWWKWDGSRPDHDATETDEIGEYVLRRCNVAVTDLSSSGLERHMGESRSLGVGDQCGCMFR